MAEAAAKHNQGAEKSAESAGPLGGRYGPLTGTGGAGKRLRPGKKPTGMLVA
jgi:hypothetical protein